MTKETLKKILVGVASLIISAVFLLVGGINPLQEVGVILAIGGTFFTLSVWYDDFIEDHKCEPLMWAVYACMLATAGLLAIGVMKSLTILFLFAGLTAVGAIVCYAIEKGMLKKKVLAEEAK